MRYVKDTAKTIVFENKIAYKNELYKKYCKKNRS